MTEFFLQILNMSLSATWLVLAVIALRFLLKKAPKWVNVLLWGLVAFRLLCPFTLESALSLIPSAQVVSPEIMMDPTPQIHTGIDSVNTVLNPVITETFSPEPAASANPLQIWIPVVSVVWCIGMSVMLLYTVVSYTRLRYRVRMAIRVKRNIYLSEFVDSPFVLGIFRPRIYLPYHMSDQDRTHVIAHERAHIHRRDHWWKPLGFLLLTLHWFNPVMWLAYIFLCRDIELACDEKVIKELGMDQRADYSQALLHCSITHRSIAACPLAFGEVGVKQRVKNVLSYKKPAFWVILISIILCIIVAVCFLTDPLNDDLIRQVVEQDGYTITSQESKNINLVIQKAWLPEDCLTLEGHTFEEKEIVPYSAYADNILYLKHVGYEDETKEYLTFTFDFVTESPEDGKLLLPYQVSTENGQTIKTYNCDVLRNEVWDNSEIYADAAHLRIPDSGTGFCVNVKTGIYEKATHHVAFALTNFNDLTYKEGSPESADAGDLPITMTLEFVSRTQAHLTFTYSKNLPHGDVQIPEAYTLEQLVDGSWEELPRLREARDLAIVAEIDNADYDAWSLPNWSEDYGTLPDGTYRIKKEVTCAAETSPIYAEFTIGGTAEDYITYTLEDITPTGAALYEQETVDDTFNLIYDAGYWLETLQDGQWTYLEPTSYVEPSFTSEKRYVYALYSSDGIELEWSHLYGELPSGTYRLAKEVTYVGDSSPRVLTSYAEFAVGPDWGIDLFLDRLSEDSVTLNVLTDDSLPAGEYYYMGAFLQVKERIGSWADAISIKESPKGQYILTGSPNLSLSWSKGQNILTDAPIITLSWSGERYQLTEGEHRIAIQIRHVLPDGTAEYNTLYEYFDPASYAWGVALDVTKITATDQEVQIEYQETYTKALPTGALSISSLDGLQKRENNQWVDIPSIVTFYSDFPDTYPIHMPGRDRGGKNLTAFFGKLSDGTYRLVRYVTRHFEDGTTETRPVYAIFVLDSGFDISLGTVTVTISHPAELIHRLTADGLSGTASYLGTGNGYNFFDYMTEDLVKILTALKESDFLPSPGITPTTSITLEHSDFSLTLLSDGETVEFDFGETINRELGQTFCVNQDALNDFFAMINSYSPENSTYEIYNVAPLEEIPPSYTLEEAAIDKVVTFIDGDINDNASIWQEFVADTTKGKSSSVRTMDYYTLPDPEHYAAQYYESIKDNYPMKVIHELTYDGKTYTLRWFEEGKEIIKTYQYLRHFTGDALSTAEYDRYEYYVLTDHATATWDDLRRSMLSSQYGAAIDHITVYSDYIYLPKNPSLPTPVKLELFQDGQCIANLTDEKKIHEVFHLLQNAEDLGFEPKTYSLGLDLILTAQDGSTTTLQLVMEEDLFKLGDTFYDYGPGYDDNGGIDNRKTLFELLGINWSDPELLTQFTAYDPARESARLHALLDRLQELRSI